MVAGYVPDTGDIAWLDFDPQAGREQGRRRPALVLTDQNYNRASGLMIVCPLTSKRKPNIREMYRGRFRIIGSVYQAAPAHRLSAVPYFQPLQLWSIAEGLSEKSRAQSH